MKSFKLIIVVMMVVAFAGTVLAQDATKKADEMKAATEKKTGEMKATTEKKGDKM